MSKESLKIAFLHPDLGIGGAERLVVDAAIGLQNKGHSVTVFTSYHDRQHCFEETRDGTLKVAVLGGSIVPRNIFGKLSLPCAILRQFHLTQQLYAKKLDFDLFIVDQLSASVPIIKYLFPKARILFYCHYPDLLLSPRTGLLKKVYRYPLDQLEQWSTSVSDSIAVNSNYTKGVFHETFGSKMPEPIVIYPAVDINASPAKDYDAMRRLENFKNKIVLSINRFERKKNIELALTSYGLLMHDTPEARDSVLVIAGGYDERVTENVEYLRELRALATTYRLPTATVFPGERFKLDKKARVVFLPSIDGSVKQLLLEKAEVLLYTPTNEHFGIVPLEAMHAKTPVLATNTGGPLETIVEGETGWMRKPDMTEWYRVLGYVLMEAGEDQLKKMGEAGKKRVAEQFSVDKLADELNAAAVKTVGVERTEETQKAFTRELFNVLYMIIAALILSVIGGYYFYFFCLWFWPHFVASMYF